MNGDTSDSISAKIAALPGIPAAPISVVYNGTNSSSLQV